MNEDIKAAVKNNLTTNYSQLFDDHNATKQLDFFIQRANIKVSKYNVLGKDNKIMLLTLYTAYLIKSNQESDGVATTIKADVFQVGMSANENGSKAYLNDFMSLLNDLNLGGWSVKTF